MLRCAASFVVAAYVQARLTPQDWRALPAELFTQPSKLDSFRTFFISPSLFNHSESWLDALYQNMPGGARIVAAGGHQFFK
jgi:hypothetical protein